MDQWKLPETSVRRSVKGALRHILAQLRAGMSPDEEPFQSLDDLPALSESQRRRFAPDPDFSVQAAALAHYLEQMNTERATVRDVSFLVAPPFSGIREALVRFPWLHSGIDSTATADWSIIAPPEDLVLDEGQARSWWDKQDLSEPWVIPELADFWLRHVSGLSLVRELFRRISAHETGPGIVGCSSWCWQFWESYLPEAHMSPRIPAPLNANYLGTWLEYLSQRNGKSAVTARMTNDGLYVLPLQEVSGDMKLRHSVFLRDLAAASRGIHGVALAIWQRALRARPDDETEAEELQAGQQGDGYSPHCWVVPLDQLSFPAMPHSDNRVLGFILHALLLHDGLRETALSAVTGLSADALSHGLSRLERAEIIRRGESGDRWHVTALGYPTVRRHLKSWGFPVDNF
ncbi:hypothetical protein BKP64_01645 [Marinobacter salinus]|uniref:Uncharacterized protein n=2 Tax=Marinobacter salinus TaxID=1874317 RepID=A0A1D9GRC3_9GAMM|nr:hypothetical protein BKP64_01645 [Marinobacter salinus]